MLPIINRLILLLVLVLGVTACNENNSTSVPNSPVRLSVNTRMEYTGFVPTSLNSYIVVDSKGYHYNKNVYPLKYGEYCGFAGVIIYITMNGEYAAFDCGCPHCLDKTKPIQPNGIYAVCPTCHEEYELDYGIGNPTKGVTKEYLRRYTTSYNAATGVVSVNN